MRTFSAAEIAEALRVQRAAFLRDGPPPLALRRNRIDRLAALAFENADAIADAVSRDFGNRPHQTTVFCDILGILTECHSVGAASASG
jgi:coniferyl-aldehyde dehydrogenase